jgi:hypothetical protein
MKRKCAATAVFMLTAAGLSVWLLYPDLLAGLGDYLVVDEEAGPVDVVVSGTLTEKVLRCYRGGTCKKIFVPVGTSPLPTYRKVKQLDAELSFREAARENGVDERDVHFLRFPYDGARDFCAFFEKTFAERKIESALFLVNYYNTRRFRFYLDRSGISAKTYVQPLRSAAAYRPEMERWWEKTTLANYYLGEYLRIFHYYFNKALWTPGF